MSGRKGKAVAQRSNSNRMKHDNTPSSHSTAAKPNVEPTISTSTEDAKQFLVPQDRTGLTLNSLSYLSQDALLFSCFNLTLLHFYCQMYLLYRQVTNIVFSGCNAHPLTRETLRTLVALPPHPQEYQYWNWRQVSLSAAGLLNVYAAISPDKKKESLSVSSAIHCPTIRHPRHTLITTTVVSPRHIDHAQGHLESRTPCTGSFVAYLGHCGVRRSQFLLLRRVGRDDVLRHRRPQPQRRHQSFHCCELVRASLLPLLLLLALQTSDWGSNLDVGWETGSCRWCC